MNYTVSESIRYFDDFLIYFGVALTLLFAFTYIYIKVTPYKELALIRAGNKAAAISLSGAMLGFAMPLASTVVNAVNLVDLALFAVLATVVQLVTFVFVRMLMPNLTRDIEAGETAGATFLAAVSVAVGLLNAAALVY
jgi:putative membrane protein